MLSDEIKEFIRVILAETDIPVRDLIEAAKAKPHYGTEGDRLGELVWHECHDRTNEALHGLPGWPECECGGCGCSEPATCTDDGGVPVCGECLDYTLDDDGQVVCSRDERVEIVTESCGAGNQTRSFARLKPPAEPEQDPDGEYACYWSTVGDDEHVVARYSTREEAEQAVAAKDFPGPTDHTNYLCGYCVRQLMDGEWCTPEQEYA